MDEQVTSERSIGYAETNAGDEIPASTTRLDLNCTTNLITASSVICKGSHRLVTRGK
jgi:hypothetical protein